MKYILILIMLSLTTVISMAQTSGTVSSSNARMSAMGGSSTSISRGIFAPGTNPANMIYNENRRIEIQTAFLPLPIPSLRLTTGTNFLSIKEYNYFFGGIADPANPSEKKGRYLTDSDKQRFSSLFDDGGNIFFDMSLPLLGLYYNNDKAGAFAFSVNERAAFNFAIPQGIIELGLYGNGSRPLFNFNETEVKAWWLRDYSLSYSKDINELLITKLNLPDNLFDQFSFGITLKYITGFAFVSSSSVDATLETGNDYIKLKTLSSGIIAASEDFGIKYGFDSLSQKKESRFSPFPSPSGNGIGIDFGFSARMNEVLTVGMAFTDLGSIKWNKNTAEFTYSSEMNLSDFSNEEQMDSLEDSGKDEGKFIDQISTSLPGAFRLGTSYLLNKASAGNGFPGELLVSVDYLQGFNNMPGNTTKALLALGFEWKPMNWIPYIRTGFAFGGKYKFNWAFGLGFNAGVFDIDIATRDFQYLVSANDLNRASLSLDTRWKF